MWWSICVVRRFFNLHRKRKLVVEVFPGVDVVLVGVGEDGGEVVGEAPCPDLTGAYAGGGSAIDDAVVAAGIGFVAGGGDGDGGHSGAFRDSKKNRVIFIFIEKKRLSAAFFEKGADEPPDYADCGAADAREPGDGSVEDAGD